MEQISKNKFEVLSIEQMQKNTRQWFLEKEKNGKG